MKVTRLHVPGRDVRRRLECKNASLGGCCPGATTFRFLPKQTTGPPDRSSDFTVLGPLQRVMTPEIQQSREGWSFSIRRSSTKYIQPSVEWRGGSLPASSTIPISSTKKGIFDHLVNFKCRRLGRYPPRRAPRPRKRRPGMWFTGFQRLFRSHSRSPISDKSFPAGVPHNGGADAYLNGQSAPRLGKASTGNRHRSSIRPNIITRPQGALGDWVQVGRNALARSLTPVLVGTQRQTMYLHTPPPMKRRGPIFGNDILFPGAGFANKSTR